MLTAKPCSLPFDGQEETRRSSSLISGIIAQGRTILAKHMPKMEASKTKAIMSTKATADIDAHAGA